MAHYFSNHVAVAYGDVVEEMVALSLELGFKVRVLGKRPAPRIVDDTMPFGA
jgi:L-fucose isomerase-like protein